MKKAKSLVVLLILTLLLGNSLIVPTFGGEYIEVNKNSYCIGDPIRITFYMPGTGSVTIWDHTTSGGAKILFSREQEGKKSSYVTATGIIEGPPGTETLEYEAYEGCWPKPCVGLGWVTDSVSFQVKDCGDNGGSSCEEWLIVMCNVGGYKLYVDGEYILTEDGDGECGVTLSAGTYTVKLKKDGCDTVTETARIECGHSTTLHVTMNCHEDCDNGRDDDGDGRIDCEDSECRDDPGCDLCKGIDCPDDTFVGEEYCKNGDVYQTYREYYCENGRCEYREKEKKVRDCEAGCENGECISPIPERETLLRIANERKNTYKKLKDSLDHEKVCMRIQKDYSALYENLWEDLLETSYNIDDIGTILDMFEMMENAVSRLENMGNLLELQRHFMSPVYNGLRDNIEKMCDLIEDEISYLEKNDFQSLKNVYAKENQLSGEILINIEVIRSGLEDLIEERIVEDPSLEESYQLELRKGQFNEKWIDIGSALHFNVFVITEGSLLYSEGEFKVEIFDEFDNLIVRGEPFVYECIPSGYQLEFGEGAVKVSDYDFALFSKHSNRFKVKVTCLEEEKFWRFSRPADIVVLVYMKSGQQPVEHPTETEKYIYENVSVIIDSLEKLIDAERKLRT